MKVSHKLLLDNDSIKDFRPDEKFPTQSEILSYFEHLYYYTIEINSITSAIRNFYDLMSEPTTVRIDTNTFELVIDKVYEPENLTEENHKEFIVKDKYFKLRLRDKFSNERIHYNVREHMSVAKDEYSYNHDIDSCIRIVNTFFKACKSSTEDATKTRIFKTLQDAFHGLDYTTRINTSHD